MATELAKKKEVKDLNKVFGIKNVIIKLATDKSKKGKVSIVAPPGLVRCIDVNNRNPMIKLSCIVCNSEGTELIDYMSGGVYSTNSKLGEDAGYVPVIGATYYSSTDGAYEQGDLVVTCYFGDDVTKKTAYDYFAPETKFSASQRSKYGTDAVYITNYVHANCNMRQEQQNDFIGPWDEVVTNTGSAGECNGAGASGDSLDENGFMDFAKIIESMSTMKNFNSSFNADGTVTVHEYIANNLVRFYHQIYYIPTLRKNYAIVVKPETLFTRAPSCNVVYPNIKNSLSYNRNIRMEPTRIMQYTDPLNGIGKMAAVPTQLVTILNIEESPVMNTVNNKNFPATRYGMPVYHSFVQSLGNHNDVNLKTQSPMTSISNYEKRNGIYGLKTQKGADFYTYLATRATGNNGKNEALYTFNQTNTDQETVGQSLGKLARYDLIATRYKTRTGSMSTYFNPYIVPGFPFVSLESNINGLNVFGYITDVAHNITDREWSTTVNFNCAHGDVEYTPVAFPIVEHEWTSKLSTQYKDMLGDTVKEVTNADIPVMVNDYNTDKQYASTSLRKIWRELTSLEEYLTDIADGATVQEEKNYMWLKNSSASEFFDVELQNRIKEYSAEILQYHVPYTDNDVR